VIDAEDEGDVLILSRRRDDDLFHCTLQVLSGILGLCKAARGFDYDLGANRGPIELRGIFLGESLDLLATDGDGMFVEVHLFVEGSENGIVLQKMGERFRIGEIVKGHEFNVIAMEAGAYNISSDAAEAVDSNFDCHCFS